MRGSSNYPPLPDTRIGCSCCHRESGCGPLLTRLRFLTVTAPAPPSRVASGAPGGYMGDYQRGNGLKNYPFGSVPICE